jgi:hypothetical protein
VIPDVLVWCVTYRFVRDEILRRELEFHILLHKFQFVLQLIGELSSGYIEARFCDSVHVWVLALLTQHFSSFCVKQNKKGKLAVHILLIKPHNSVQNVKISDYSLFTFLAVAIRTPVVNIPLICYGFVLPA